MNGDGYYSEPGNDASLTMSFKINPFPHYYYRMEIIELEYFFHAGRSFSDQISRGIRFFNICLRTAFARKSGRVKIGRKNEAAELQMPVIKSSGFPLSADYLSNFPPVRNFSNQKKFSIEYFLDKEDMFRLFSHCLSLYRSGRKGTSLSRKFL